MHKLTKFLCDEMRRTTKEDTVMCKSFIEIKKKKIVRAKGRFIKGHWLICLECGVIQYEKDGKTVKWCRTIEQ